jgi:hypothetical protein
MKTFFHALKETSQLFIGNFSTTANISMSICYSVDWTLVDLSIYSTALLILLL